MSKGGTTTQGSTTEIPQWVQDAGKEQYSTGKELGQIGYTPYYGADVAAFNPMQESAFRATGSAADAFGIGPAGTVPTGATFGPHSPTWATDGIQAPTTYAGGVQGYSGMPMYSQALKTLGEQAPAQKEALERQFIDPTTGLTPEGRDIQDINGLYNEAFGRNVGLDGLGAYLPLVQQGMGKNELRRILYDSEEAKGLGKTSYNVPIETGINGGLLSGDPYVAPILESGSSGTLTNNIVAGTTVDDVAKTVDTVDTVDTSAADAAAAKVISDAKIAADAKTAADAKLIADAAAAKVIADAKTAADAAAKIEADRLAALAVTNGTQTIGGLLTDTNMSTDTISASEAWGSEIDTLNKAYMQEMGRPVGEEGLLFYGQQLKDGTDISSIIADLAYSGEGQAYITPAEQAAIDQAAIDAQSVNAGLLGANTGGSGAVSGISNVVDSAGNAGLLGANTGGSGAVSVNTGGSGAVSGISNVVDSAKNPILTGLTRSNVVTGNQIVNNHADEFSGTGATTNADSLAAQYALYGAGQANNSITADTGGLSSFANTVSDLASGAGDVISDGAGFVNDNVIQNLPIVMLGTAVYNAVAGNNTSEVTKEDTSVFNEIESIVSPIGEIASTATVTPYNGVPYNGIGTTGLDMANAHLDFVNSQTSKHSDIYGSTNVAQSPTTYSSSGQSGYKFGL